MLAIRTILHPTDFSERSDYAFRLACALARDHGSRLIVVHVAGPVVTAYGDMIVTEPIEATFKELKSKLLAIQGPDALLVEHRLEEGEPATQILEVARDCRCDLIVMGTHGRRGLNRLLMGSVAEQVMRKAPCPVVTVKTPFPEVCPAPAVPVPEEVHA
jgi:nucleotide-binding universal stress UspA family protein